MKLKILEAFFKDYYNDFRTWAQNMPIDTAISIVKKELPSYVTVDWENPEKLGKGLLYPLIRIKGHRTTKSRDYLGFVDDLYSGHIFMKL